MKDDLIKLMTNKNYLCLCIAFSAQYSVYTCMAAVISSLTTPYEYPPLQTSIVAGSFIISGIIGSIIFST